MLLNSETLHDGGVIKVWPAVTHEDPRGAFTELYREDDLACAIHQTPHFVQMNLSRSIAFCLRGMHYHTAGNQAKFLRPIYGDIYQVSVDARRDSPTFGSWVGTYLRTAHNEAVWIPPGFANGFCTFHMGSVVLYQMTAPFVSELDAGFRWDDQQVNIKWPFGTGTSLTISPKDRAAPALAATPGWAP